MHDTSLRKMPVTALICGTVLVSWPVMGDQLFLGGSGLGIRQPFGLVVITPCAENTSAGGELYLQSFDFVADHTQAYAVTWDRLRLVDLQTDAVEDLGRFEYGLGYRWDFGLDEFDSWPPFGLIDEPDLDGVTTYSYNLTGTLTFLFTELDDVPQEAISIAGSTSVPIEETVLLDQVYSYPPEGPVELSVRLIVTLMDDGLFQLELFDFEGPGGPFFSGQIVVGVPGSATAGVLIHSIHGLSLSPEGEVHVLSAAASEPTAEPILYRVTPQIDETGRPILDLFPLAALDTSDVWAIDYADDGTLFGAGESLYVIDPESGATSHVGVTGAGLMVELDFGPDGTLYGISHGDDERSDLYALDTTTGEALLITPIIGETVWGFGVLPYNVRDLNRDGMVDDDDFALYHDEFTGSLSEAFVPPGPGGTGVPDVLRVPFVDWIDFSTLEDNDAARFDMDATDTEFPGIVVVGPLLDADDSSARIYLMHTEESLFVGIEVIDADIDDIGATNNDQVEIYLDSNNSDLPVTEGDPFGFQADNGGHGPGNGTVWNVVALQTLQGYGAQFTIDKNLTEMVTGGTYGFDVAVQEVDDEGSGDQLVTRYFLFSTDDDGMQNEQLWGDIFLSPSGLAGRGSAPAPAHQATSVEADPILSWTAGTDAVSHNVYLGAEPDDLVYQGNQEETSFIPGLLSKGWTYYWRIDEVNENGIRTGSVWWFATAPSPADLDGDGDVDSYDLRILVQDPLGDIDGDGLVDGADFTILYQALGAVVGDPDYSALFDFDSDGEITTADYQIWLCHYQTDIEFFFIAGDIDGDGDVDLLDYSAWLGCVTGPGGQVTEDCIAADLDADTDVDLHDFGVLMILLGV
ncbi:MAG: hypothetical protein IID37_05890 [Planctomycetes bacterium]|nr:hypothetical protein [Planctomycetota bacterium]